ncbi:DAK2 domain-containing protein [Bradyrhizobium sp. SEMIA]|uniref:DAK2 domain-containing protein n=1 Tax=Bradyrhizobium sp. SEMIA TaxID=2597515 RepID=UPI00223F81C9|nr:DAK2 domain-containing protein [Bradyrhizobium sp. SEMIA]
MGDGDTGVMLRRLFEAIAAAIPDQETDIGSVFQACAKACASGTGSSLGTLVTVAMMTLAKATKGRGEVGWIELGPLLASVRDQMMARGGAMLGDKTVVDMVDAVAVALVDVRTRKEAAEAARKAVRETLDAFRNRPNRLGRARMFGERTMGSTIPACSPFRSCWSPSRLDTRRALVQMGGEKGGRHECPCPAAPGTRDNCRGQDKARRALGRAGLGRAGSARSAQPWRGPAGDRRARSRGLP